MISSEWLDFGLRFLLNAITIIVIARVIYFTKYRNREFLFTFVLFNNLIFLLCALLSKASIELGFAFGLFAIFSILRYRTVTIPVREMGYFFLSVTVGIINGLVTSEEPYLWLIAINAFMIFLIYIMDRSKIGEYEASIDLTISDLTLIHVEKKELLIAYLHEQTGISFHDVNVRKIDYFKNVARVTAFYYGSRPLNNLPDDDE